jgi:hypothetical protein
METCINCGESIRNGNLTYRDHHGVMHSGLDICLRVTKARAEAAEAEAAQLRKVVELRDGLIAELRAEILELDPS